MTGNRTLEEHTEHLLKCLQTELSLSDQLVELGKLQESALISNRDEMLHEVTSAQDNKLRQLAAARKRSEAAVKALADEIGADAATVTLSGLADGLDEPMASAIREITDKLVHRAADLYKQNLINRNLLNNAVQYVSFCLRLISGIDDNAQYCRGNASRMRLNSLILDHTA